MDQKTLSDKKRLQLALALLKEAVEKKNDEWLKKVEDFLAGTLPEPRRFFLSVTKAPHDLPGFAAYVYPTLSEAQPGEIPVGQILLNLDCILWSCVSDPDVSWREVAAESIGHEIIHAIQELLGQELEEYHVDESIQAARESGESSEPLEPPAWQDKLDVAMITANPGAVVIFADSSHPEASFVLRKKTLGQAVEKIGEIPIEDQEPNWCTTDPTLIDITIRVDDENTTLIAWKKKDKDDET